MDVMRNSNRTLPAVSLIILSLFVWVCASADNGRGLDPASEQALRETQLMLKNPTERQKTQGAQNVQRQLEAMGASAQDQEEIYGLAADVMADVTRQANGDPEKMMQILSEAQKNPQAFGIKLTPAQRQKLQDIAKKLPQEKQRR